MKIHIKFSLGAVNITKKSKLNNKHPSFFILLTLQTYLLGAHWLIIALFDLNATVWPQSVESLNEAKPNWLDKPDWQSLTRLINLIGQA